MASGRTLTGVQMCKRFQRGLQILLDTFHDTILLYTQDIQVVNFSDINNGYINVIIMYRNAEGRSVKLEAVGKIDKDYVHTLDFLWQAMKRAAQEAPSDYSGPFSPLTLPTHNDLLSGPESTFGHHIRWSSGCHSLLPLMQAGIGRHQCRTRNSPTAHITRAVM